ncbi:hypothetical protein ALT_4714 [Aspergillus lentulus]|uniref:Uncharacterized protein n=1 Tax=Aspergillus lentulus TaxID=293939 RepID=A0AAN5YKF3_ASPLE|nr:hypothetical protein CNMCM6936_004518 [Aspergillus lentulus]KAF4174856.1 hypothetical protein CNMCM8060_008072 [Aspergillus lentulus]KAF4183933.1 hypothetical protein CNMCM7927_008485 [Aspergillus lentulus]KAF4194991.1 hypothetical protein CNMCM8694_006885 [Aspergillus lentulus]KAF4201835.1 hypothetical protein CNMCM8927_000987 [Aspergillus lentulus]
MQRWSQGSSVVKRTTDKLVARADIWDVYVEKGRRLHCAMNGDQEVANQYANTPVSHLTDYGDLVKYGWVVSPSRDPYETLFQTALEGALEELNIDESNNRLARIDHSRDVTVDGTHYEKSGAYYESLFNADAGLIVADDNRNPPGSATGLDSRPGRAAELVVGRDLSPLAEGRQK